MNSFKAQMVGALLMASLPFIGACQKESESTLKVANGEEAKNNEFPSVVLLLSEHGEKRSVCTGTFITDSHVITAAHCIPKVSKPHRYLNYIVGDKGKGYQVAAPAISVAIHPSYGKSPNAAQDPHDLAIVQFPIGSALDQARLSTRTPSIEDEATIVGFGSDQLEADLSGTLQGEGAGVKRFGTNRNLKIEDGLLVAKGLTSSEESINAGRWVSAGKGDSGGPLFVDGRLVGISSSGSVQQNHRGTLVGISRFVDLTREDNSEFIQKSID